MKILRSLIDLLLLAVLGGVAALIALIIVKVTAASFATVAVIVAVLVYLPLLLAQLALRRPRQAPDTFQASLDPSFDSQDPLVVMYCAGLPLVVERPLTPDERARMKKTGRRARVGGCLLALALPVLFIVMLAMFNAWFEGASRQGSEVPEAIGAIVCLLLILGLSIVVLWTRGRLKHAGKMRRTLKAGYVRRFEGYLRNIDPTENAFKILGEAKLLPDYTGGPTVIELMPHLDEIYSIDDVRVPEGVALPVTKAVAVPDAPVLDMPDEWTGGGWDSNYKRRPSSPEERREIAGYARPDLKFWGALALVSFGAYMALMKGFVLFKAPGWLALPAALTVAWFVYIEVLWDRIRTGRQLQADSDFGWIWVRENTAESDTEITPGVPLEYLPISGRIWTVNQKPAAWRRL